MKGARGRGKHGEEEQRREGYMERKGGSGGGREWREGEGKGNGEESRPTVISQRRRMKGVEYCDRRGLAPCRECQQMKQSKRDLNIFKAGSDILVEVDG